MFNQSKNRIDYGDLLDMGPDYELDQAVGFTYSLDMEALMGIPLCLEMHEEMATDLKNKPLYVLESIRRIKKKLSIFCNAGCIKVPQKESKLYALMEECIHEVRMPDYKYNFHPKLWIVQYHNRKDINSIIIKVVVLSRNLTFDQSLDVAVEMNGIVSNEKKSKNQPLVDLLTFVSQFDNDISKYNELISNVSRVDKFDLLEEFDDYAFHPFGIYGKNENNIKKIAYNQNVYNPMDLFKNCDSIFIVSPFLSENIITEILSFKDKESETGPINRCLITREKSITENIFNSFNARNGDGIWMVNPSLCFNDNLEDDIIFEQITRDIHAKIYYTEKHREPKKLYLGSLNASNNAFYNNVEFLLELTYKKYKISYKSFFEDLICDSKKSPFLKMNVYEKTTDIDGEDDLDFREEIYSLKRAEVLKNSNDFTIKVYSEKAFENITLCPLFMKEHSQNIEKEIKFDGIPLNRLSNFFIITKNNKNCLVRLDVEGMPNDDRDNAIFNDIISNNSSLMTYMKYLLDEDYDGEPLESLYSNNDGGNQSEVMNNILFEDDLYERMLKASAMYPERIESMHDVINKVDSNKVNEEFKHLLELFINTKKKIEEHGGKRM